jgi:hypothetical protein
MSHSLGVDAGRALSARGEAVNVPGIGQVEWSRAQLDNHAELVNRTHLPDRPPRSIRLRWPIPVPRATRWPSCCASCALDWPCPESRWATTWMSAKQRFLRAITNHGS